MPHLVDDLRLEAEEAMARMREAAHEARRAHAHAELLRHMLTTARKNAGKPREEAIAAVAGEWMAAWNLRPGERPDVAREMQAFVEAFHDYANAPDDARDERIRSADAALEAAYARSRSSIADEMAFRSQCAHGWWELIEPVPADLPGRASRPSVPGLRAGLPFWDAGCAAFCL